MTDVTPPNSPTGSGIVAGCFKDLAWIRVQGPGNNRNAPDLANFLGICAEQGVLRYVVDLEECSLIDSTFMGTLCSHTLKLSARGGRTDVINANERNRTALRKLGLHKLMALDAEQDTWARERLLVAENLSHPIRPVAMDREAKTEICLEAHEALVKANVDNLPLFKDVIQYLKMELGGEPPT